MESNKKEGKTFPVSINKFSKLIGEIEAEAVYLHLYITKLFSYLRCGDNVIAASIMFVDTVF